MNKQTPWLSEVIEAIKYLGGQATLADIYSAVEDRGKIDLSLYTDWKAQIRKNIYLNSNDTYIFKGKPGDKTDIFYSIEGKGKGIWGLRAFEPKGNNVDLTEDDLGFIEGKKKLRQHIYRERNPKVIRIAKEKFKKENNGRLFCEICGFDFYETYGEIGEDFIEGHHTIPVSELEEGQVTKVEDIAIVCSNCHRMLHRKRPWLTKEQLKELIKYLKDF
ncbi:HNH endonuclease [Peribacillus simplex]|uniref:HNH endonuclease n=1 Tax=Peribacillus simplex TaxID=1478 RepID=UPI0024C1EDDA|nr:HNH endonuclease [Peribacillus simplex]MDR4928273.1 HNH endonuclease [Peribacillus simplex]WHX92035.1 HNH endonuclease [Peribacillus simplex]